MPVRAEGGNWKHNQQFTEQKENKINGKDTKGKGEKYGKRTITNSVGEGEEVLEEKDCISRETVLKRTSSTKRGSKRQRIVDPETLRRMRQQRVCSKHVFIKCHPTHSYVVASFLTCCMLRLLCTVGSY